MPIDLSNAWKNGNRIVNGAISLVPNVILARATLISTQDGRRVVTPNVILSTRTVVVSTTSQKQDAARQPKPATAS